MNIEGYDALPGGIAEAYASASPNWRTPGHLARERVLGVVGYEQKLREEGKSDAFIRGIAEFTWGSGKTTKGNQRCECDDHVCTCEPYRRDRMDSVEPDPDAAYRQGVAEKSSAWRTDARADERADALDPDPDAAYAAGVAAKGSAWRNPGTRADEREDALDPDAEYRAMVARRGRNK